LMEKCNALLLKAISKHLFLEVIAFCRELVRVLPASEKPGCYIRSAEAMMALHKLDEAEELLHEGLAVCRQKGTRSRVSQTTRCERLFLGSSDLMLDP
jgi:hypothetical protein